MEEPKRTIAYLCPKCKQSVVVEETVFRLAAAPISIPCPCGGSALKVEMEADHVDLTVPCLYCEEDHHIRCSAHAFLHERALAFSCKATGLDTCYVGEEGAVFRALRRLETAAAQITEQAQEAGAFLNEASCTCGSREYKVKVQYSAVELICADCGAKLRLPAATDEDLEDLCCCYTLKIGGREA